ncbi:hypothetical protein MMC07_005937 [Pseudocyphellaria aurata]|nr:hypothetical protein [Pseudocyphellaria aurata]
MEKEYVTKNAEEIEKVWIQSDNNGKAKLWLKRFLHESLMVHPGSSKEAIAVEVDDWGEKIEKLSRQMNIYCEMRKMPDHKTGQRLVVLGLNEQAVRSRFAEIHREAQRIGLRAMEEQEEREMKALADFEKRFALAKSKGKSSKRKWDLSGQWEISCHYMEGQWGSEDDACSLEIKFTKPTETGLVQMYALFDFIAITGIMRFVNQDAREDAQDEDKKGRPSRKYDCTNDENSDEAEESDDDSSIPTDFLFPSVALPSSTSRDFGFRWRGEETGEGEIQLDSDEKLCSITFESPNALTGVFISGLTGTIEFKGFKEGFETEAKASGPRKQSEAAHESEPSYAWQSRNGAAYERARVGRWG